jgi:hypothetical protein
VTAAGTINKRPITVTAATDTKTYDGTTSSTGSPITVGSLATGDTTTTFTQVFDSRHAGPRTLIASGIVSDGNGGANYSYTFQPAAGTINKRPITVTALTNTKYFDGTTSAAAVPTISGLGLVGGDTAAFIETYDTPNVGTNKTLTPSGSVNDGNSGNNYNVTPVTNNTGVILGYVFTGFFSPLTTAGTPAAPSDAGSFNFNRVVPVKWQLRDGAGNLISSLSTLTSFVVTRNDSCVVGPASGVSLQLYNPTTGAAGGTTFRYDSGSSTFIFNWDPTQTSTPGCFNIVVSFNDNRSYSTFIRLQ